MSFVDKLLPKDKPVEYFLTLKIGVETIDAVVWEVKGNAISIIGQVESAITEKQDIIEAADIAISDAEKNLPQGKIVEKVIFGLPYEFTEANKIKHEVLGQLKKLTQKLSLTPLGFIELPEALAHFLKTREDSPTSAILLGVGPKNLTVSLLRVGKIYENFIYQRGEKFLKDVEEAFKGLESNEVLPSRVLLYDESSDLERLAEELIKHPWHKTRAFLHIPKIEVISEGDVIHALIEAAGAEITKTVSGEEFKTTKTLEEKDEAALLGFQKDKDVLEEVSEEKEDIAPPPRGTKEEWVEDETIPEKSKFPSFKVPSFSLSLPNLPNLRLPSFGDFRFLPVIIILLILIALGGIGVYAYYQIPKAEVRILVSSESMQKDVDIIFSPSAQAVDSENLIIPASPISTEVSGEKKVETTGKKNVGNPARGTITIFNKTTNSKTLPNGTSLLANNLKFTLDDDVNIASASDTGEGLTYGKVSAKITANSIGPEGNLAGGTNFTFADFPQSSYTAKNTDALGGGSSRQVSVVSKEDQDNLLTDLSSDLKEKAKSALFEKQESSEKILDESMKVDIVDKKFDKNVDSEATSLSLSLSAKVSGLAYKMDDLNLLARQVLVNNIPPAYEFSTQTNIKVNNTKLAKDGTLKASSIISAQLMPKISLDKIQKDLAGKSLQSAQDYLRGEKNVAGVEIHIDSPFPFGKDKLPLNSQNIRLSVAGSS